MTLTSIFLPAVVVLLHFFFWIESHEGEVVTANSILNSLEDHRQLTLLGQQRFEFRVLFFSRFIDGFEFVETLSDNLGLRVSWFQLRNFALQVAVSVRTPRVTKYQNPA